MSANDPDELSEDDEDTLPLDELLLTEATDELATDELADDELADDELTDDELTDDELTDDELAEGEDKLAVEDDDGFKQQIHRVLLPIIYSKRQEASTCPTLIQLLPSARNVKRLIVTILFK